MYSYKYPRAALTVDAIVVAGKKEIKVLLVKRGSEPFKNMWALPGGFVDIDERLVDSCQRELNEETGLTLDGLTLFGVYDSLDRDPRHRTISVVYYTFINKAENVTGQDDAIDAAWFPVNGLPPLAFDHQQILDDFRDKILLHGTE